MFSFRSRLEIITSNNFSIISKQILNTRHLSDDANISLQI